MVIACKPIRKVRSHNTMLLKETMVELLLHRDSCPELLGHVISVRWDGLSPENPTLE